MQRTVHTYTFALHLESEYGHDPRLLSMARTLMAAVQRRIACAIGKTWLTDVVNGERGSTTTATTDVNVNGKDDEQIGQNLVFRCLVIMPTSSPQKSWKHWGRAAD
jgi:hypothetical protein